MNIVLLTQLYPFIFKESNVIELKKSYPFIFKVRILKCIKKFYDKGVTNFNFVKFRN